MSQPVSILGFDRNEKAIEREYNRQQGKGDFLTSDLPIMFLKEGQTIVRILPPYSEAGQWFKEFKEHSVSSETGKFMGTVACPEQFNEFCPFCQEGRRLHEIGDEKSVAASKELRPRPVFYFNVLVLSAQNSEVGIANGVQVLKTGITLKRELLEYDHDVSGGYGDITNIYTGRDVRISRRGNNRNNTEYTIRVNPQVSNVLETLQNAGIDPNGLALHNLDKAAVIVSQEKIQELFSISKNIPSVTQTKPPLAATPAQVVVPTVFNTPPPQINGFQVKPPAPARFKKGVE